MRRADSLAADPSERTTHAAAPVLEVLRDSPAAAVTSEVGLLEFHDIVTLQWRDNANYPNCDETWRNAAIAGVMQDIADGRLVIRRIPPQVFEQAMSLATLATREHGRKLRVWDAVHLVSAVRLAADLGEPVDLWTTDGDFGGFLDVFPHFATYIRVRNLDS